MAGSSSCNKSEDYGDMKNEESYFVPLHRHGSPRESYSKVRYKRRSHRLVAKRLQYSESPDVLKSVESTEQFSDYGTGSEHSFRLKTYQETESWCLSPPSSLNESDEDLLSDIFDDHTLSPGYVQHSELDRHLSDLSLHEEDRIQENKISSFLDISNLTCRALNVKVINGQGIYILVPLEGYRLPKGKTLSRQHPFSVTVTKFNVEAALLKRGLRITQSSPVFRFDPPGTKFCELYPAIASINLEIIPSEQVEVICLHNCSNSHENGWQILHEAMLSKDRTRVMLRTHLFGFITVVIRQKFQQTCKYIRCRAGGRMTIPEVNVTVDFPKGSISEDIEVMAKVCFDREFSSKQFFSSLHENVNDYTTTVASPTICLEPHGLYFEQPVKITVPIPDYDGMMETMKTNNNTANLRILHSNTQHEPGRSDWQYLDTHFDIQRVRCKNGTQMMLLTFSVHHFSFFRVVWDKISNSLHQARTSMLYFLYDYAMKVQAYCEEFENDRFGLVVICFQEDRKFPQNQTYKFQVGQSQKKLIKPGRLVVKLKSLYFIADIEAGEDENLEKEEDFRGWDFEKQFACKFKPGNKPERGPFGKVTITRNKNSELLFEFNIQKYGHENENTPCMEDRWGQHAITELAAAFFITDGDNWKKLATHIGFTKTEIKSYFKNTADPLNAIITKYKQRGGTADEFVTAIYSVHRDLKNNMSSPSSSKQSRSSNNSSGRGSMQINKYNKRGGHESDTSGTRTSLYSQDSLLSSTRKRSNTNTSHGSAGSRIKKRRLQNTENKLQGSDGDCETSSVSEGENSREKCGTDAQSIELRKDMTKLNNSFLWELSADIDNITWRALGRSLGVEESTLINIEHAHKTSGFREMAYQVLLHWKEKYPKRCTYGTLYSALRKENMNSTAKKMIQIQGNDNNDLS